MRFCPLDSRCGVQNYIINSTKSISISRPINSNKETVCVYSFNLTVNETILFKFENVDSFNTSVIFDNGKVVKAY